MPPLKNPRILLYICPLNAMLALPDMKTSTHVVFVRPTAFWMLFFTLFFGACSPEKQGKQETLFYLHDAAHTGIAFRNELSYTEQLNPYTFRNFYNGGGVGLGDLNGDGLLDVFFSGNLVANKLYLNKGGFRFEEVGAQAGLRSEGVWTTGVALVDVNGDGKLDIYTCKSGPPGGKNRHNEFFINTGNDANGVPHFEDRARALGLDDEGLSTHAAFFDYDKDGDLDLYLLNNSLRSVGGYDLRKDQRNIPDPQGGNKLYRNDGGRFTDASRAAGIYTSAIGFGLGVTIGDLDKDGWQDIFVSNDFFERDYLYINNHDGTFTESLESWMREISMGSMGADMADINNDALPEIFVTEMLPEHDARLKTTTQFEKWDKYQAAVSKGYYHQFSRNALQRNLGRTPDGQWAFAELSRLAGVHATDWSWGALIFDLDNDGLKDIFVANGIYKDLLDQDYVNFIGNPDMVRSILMKKKAVIKQLIDSIPSHKVPNYAFHNLDGTRFENRAQDWGLGLPSHSNGSAYGDLDNDGDLDLVVNNVNMPAFVYENRSEQFFPQHHHLTLSLRGEGQNTFALGAKATLYAGGKAYYQELAPMRGFMSSVDYRLHFGLGRDSLLDSLIVEWPNQRVTRLQNVRADRELVLAQKDALPAPARPARPLPAPLFQKRPLPKGLGFRHAESAYVDFDRERLLFLMSSNEGPCTCTADVNRDGRDDLYLGGASGQAGKLYAQTPNGAFRELEPALFDKDKDSEDTGCAFFDANGDGWPDLYVASGSNEGADISLALLDRLYLNQGNGRFEKSPQVFPSPAQTVSTAAVKPADYDGDGDIDLFVGGRIRPGFYGAPQQGYILKNDGRGGFSDVTPSVAPGLLRIGMITDAAWADLDGDKALDLVVVGDWMPVRVFLQKKGKLEPAPANTGLEASAGWYHALALGDFNKDGRPDLVTGNHGLNSRFKASQKEPISLYINDFDNNGTIEQILARYDGGKELPLVLRGDLVMQIPSLKKKYLRFENYVNQGIADMFPSATGTKVLQVQDLASALWLNQGGGRFKRIPLPLEAQFAPVYALEAGDFNGDGNLDVFAGGNQHNAKPEMGTYRSGYGVVLLGNGKGGFETLPPARSGIWEAGQIRSTKVLKINDKNVLFLGKNDDVPQIFQFPGGAK